MSDIRDRLLRHQPFANIIAAQPKEWPIHLIPVSAVGEGFAQYDESSGTMHKFVEINELRPLNVELSIMLAMVDQLKILKDSVDGRGMKKLKEKQLRNYILESVRPLSERASFLAPILNLVGVPLSFSGSEKIPLAKLICYFREYIGEKQAELECDIERTKSEVNDQKGAFLSMLKRSAALWRPNADNA